MTDTTTESPTVAPESGRFDRLALTMSLVIDPRHDPLPVVEMGGVEGDIPTIRFADYRAALAVHLQRGDRHSQAAYLYALGASISALAREVEGR